MPRTKHNGVSVIEEAGAISQATWDKIPSSKPEPPPKPRVQETGKPEYFRVWLKEPGFVVVEAKTLAEAIKQAMPALKKMIERDDGLQVLRCPGERV